MQANSFIYGLVDPRDGEIRYVGQTTQGLIRARHHRMPSFMKNSARTHKTRWIQKLISLGLDYETKVLEEVPDPADLDWVEMFWIAQLRGMGARLTNATDGGYGCRGYKRSEEWKQAMSKRMSGAGSHFYGKKLSFETRVKMSRTRGGRPVVDSNGVVYASVAEAARRTNLNEDSIRAVVNHKRGSISVGGGRGYAQEGKGLKFKYVDEGTQNNG